MGISHALQTLEHSLGEINTREWVPLIGIGQYVVDSCRGKPTVDVNPAARALWMLEQAPSLFWTGYAAVSPVTSMVEYLLTR